MSETMLSTGAGESHERRRRMLLTAFGPAITAALQDPAVLEIMVNPDGRLWIDRTRDGRSDSGIVIGAAETERIIRIVAAHVRREVTDKTPIISAELPDTGERFEGLLPPVAMAPCFSIRKPAGIIFRLEDYVAAGIMTAHQAGMLTNAVRERRNIVVVGGTSSGKTTLVNALLAEIARLDERVVVLEDTRELSCMAKDTVQLRTKPGVASLADLVRSTLRLRPDRIIVGEVRGPEALDMLKAWNTGHPGGLTTIHANTAEAALLRLEQLIQEAVITVPRDLIALTVEVLVFIEGRGSARRVTRLIEVDGLDDEWRVSVEAARPAGAQGGDAMTYVASTVVGLHRMVARVAMPIVALAVLSTAAQAAGSGMPWEAPLQRILESVEGPVAKVAAVVIIILTGLSLAFGDMSGGFRRLVQIVFGLSIAFAATSFFLSFFAFAGGATIG